VSTKLPLAGAVATLIGIPGAMASYNFVTLIDPNSSGFTLASGINGGGEVVGSYHGIGQIIGSFVDATGAATATCCPSAHTRDTSFDTSGACRQLPPPESHVMYLTKRPPCT
jgi:hypothetical protein